MCASADGNRIDEKCLTVFRLSIGAKLLRHNNFVHPQFAAVRPGVVGWCIDRLPSVAGADQRKTLRRAVGYAAMHCASI